MMTNRPSQCSLLDWILLPNYRSCTVYVHK
jgi:hypothetical protein